MSEFEVMRMNELIIDKALRRAGQELSLEENSQVGM